MYLVVKKEVPKETVVSSGTSFKTLIALASVAIGLIGGSVVANGYLQNELKDAQAKNNEIGIQIRQLEDKNAKEIKSSAYTDIDGLTANQMEKDQETVAAFFKPVFQYKNGSEYDATRDSLVGLLGENNSLLRYYLPKNEKIDKQTRVDLEGTKRQYKGVTLYPVSKVLKGYQYLVIVEFIYYKATSDLQHINDLKSSYAVIRCDVVEDGKNKYTVQNVNGYGGY